MKRRSMLRAAAVTAALGGAALLAACDAPGGASKPSFKATDVTGADYGKTLALTDHTGAPRSLADFAGKVVVLFFGFTQCPDVCPTTLATMSDVMKRLGPDSDRVQVIFVTVDPDRDTPAVLGPYVTAFDPRFLALYGDKDAIAEESYQLTLELSRHALSLPGVSGIHLTDFRHDGSLERLVRDLGIGPAFASDPVASASGTTSV